MYTIKMAWLFASTLLLGSCLLFLVQPLCARMLLPTLGGTPAVWSTCMVFFQASLLVGYAYAHFGPRLLGLGPHVAVHVVMLPLALLCLPLTLPRAVAPPAWPILWLMQVLVGAVGLPFFACASCAPLLQRWYVRASGDQDPYFLYAASNFGSFGALLLYPFVIEPTLTLAAQARLWMLGYVLLVGASLACALCLRLRAPVASEPARPTSMRPTVGTRLRWLLLSLVPSSLMLSVTNYLTTDIAAIPLLWIVPLGIYLLTFTLVFARRPFFPHRAMVRWMPLVVVVLAVIMLQEASEPVFVVMTLHLVGLFWLAMVCHGELARTRPPADRLTEFYLWLACGGVLGGVFNVLVAPLVFKSLVEYPLMIAAACLLRPALAAPPAPCLAWRSSLAVGILTLGLVFLGRSMDLDPGPLSVAVMFALPLLLAYFLQEGPYRFGLCIALIFAASAFYPGIHGGAVYRARSFFGVHRVTEQGGFRKLFHGNILHGQQSLDPRQRSEPLTYYYRTGPIGQVLKALHGDQRLQRVGLIGLGTGALASYAAPGEHWTFFEIDPTVIHIASPAAGLFTYLKDCQGRIDVVVGDARLTLSQQADKYGLLVIDAFGSDAIPLHLLTREALQGYLTRLTDDGILAFHISNRYVDLEPVLANLADDAHLICRIQKDLGAPDAGSQQSGKLPSVWVLMTRAPQDLAPLASSTLWDAARGRPGMGVWTDDFSNLVSVLRASE